GSSSSVPLVDINNTFQYAGALTWTRGTHNIKIGGGLIRRQINAAQDTNGGGLFLFWGQPGPPEPLPDDRRGTPKLTLNLGVRYDVFTPITEAHGHYSNFLPNCLPSGSIGANCS